MSTDMPVHLDPPDFTEAVESLDPVYVAIMHSAEVSSSHYQSMIATLLYEGANHRRLQTDDEGRGGRVNTRYTAANSLNKARNDLVSHYLKNSDCPWLWLIDSDMSWQPEILTLMLTVADEVERPVVGALCFGFKAHTLDHLHAPNIQYYPVLYGARGDGGYAHLSDFPRNSLIKVHGTGAACLVIHRSVIERIHERWGPHWFSPWPLSISEDGTTVEDYFGEDLSFMKRLHELEVPIHVHTGIQAAHHKSVWIQDDVFTRFTKTLPNIVVIPFIDGADMTVPLVEQLLDQGEVTEIWCYDNGAEDDTVERLKALDDPRVVVIEFHDASLHAMWNDALERTAERDLRANVAFLNNDLRLGPRFIGGLAEALRSDWDVGAVGPRYDTRPGSGYVEVTDIAAGRYDGSGGLPGWAFMIRSGAEHGYRYPEPEGGGIWFGDTDLVSTFVSSGGRILLNLDVECEHLGGGSQSGGDWSDYAEAIAVDRRHYLERWAPDHPEVRDAHSEESAMSEAD